MDSALRQTTSDQVKINISPHQSIKELTEFQI